MCDIRNISLARAALPASQLSPRSLPVLLYEKTRIDSEWCSILSPPIVACASDNFSAAHVFHAIGLYLAAQKLHHDHGSRRRGCIQSLMLLC
jgi:hypothetical protein